MMDTVAFFFDSSVILTGLKVVISDKSLAEPDGLVFLNTTITDCSFL